MGILGVPGALGFCALHAGSTGAVALHRAGRLTHVVTQNIDNLHQLSGLGPDAIIEKLPMALQELIARSMALQTKVRRLDITIHAPTVERAAIGNPLVPQLNRLKAAFER